MASVLRRVKFEQRHKPSVCRSLSGQLAEAHHQLLREMENMEAITRELRPEENTLANARWQISQASLRKRALVARIIEYLVARVAKDATHAVVAVRTADQQLVRKSALHIRTWPMHLIQEDWRGYCEASRTIRSHMGAQISLEKQTLAPMLRQLADREL
jgi:hypothetical protein